MRIRTVAVALLSGSVTLLTACSGGGGATSDPNTTAGQTGGDGCTNAQQLATWDVERRLGQLLMGGVAVEGDTALQESITAIQKGQVGGVNYLGPSYAYADGQLALAVDAGGEVPPLLAVDQEGGRVQRLTDVMEYIPSAREMGATLTAHQVEEVGQQIGKKMSKLSLNMNLAPVVDVSDQYDDAVIGDRSFSANAKQVTEYAGAFAEGLRKEGVIPVLKHFPGLGSGTGNTDFEEASTPSLTKLKKHDLVPYESLLLESPLAVMLTNAKVPGLTEGKPATLAASTYQLLREEYGFAGVAMTDSLTPVAAQTGKSLPKVVEQALAAGADIALWDGLTEAHQIVKHLARAVADGDLPEARVNEAVDRVLTLKRVDLCAGR